MARDPALRAGQPARTLKIAVMGAGAVGCYYGGMLARAGHDVTLIGRAQHIQAAQRGGLRLETQAFDVHVPVRASSEVAAVSIAQWVLCCVKSVDSELAAAQMAPHLAADARILCLQNGVDNAERLQARLSQQVLPAVVYVASEMAGPGHVRHRGRGELVVPAAPACQDLAALFVAAGVPVELSDNVTGALWAKLILNCAYNALSAITQRPYGPLAQGEGISRVMRDIVAECLAVARAEGIIVPGDTWHAVERIARTMPSQLSSTAQDLARGRRSEIDHLNGHIVKRGEALGVATPVNRALHAVVKLIESRSAAPA